MKGAMLSRFQTLSVLLNVILLQSNADAFQICLPHRIPRTSTKNVLLLFDSTEESSSVDRNNKKPPPTPTSKDEIPSMDWLTDSLSNPRRDDDDGASTTRSDMTEASPFMEEHDGREGDLGDVPIPTTGISVSDEMEKTQKDRFFTELVPIQNGLDKGVRAAQIVTSATAGSFEPVRYVVGLSKQKVEDNQGETTITNNKEEATTTDSFVMIDVPPFSEQLKNEIQDYIGPNGRLSAILVTSRDCIHYDEAPGVFTVRRADLVKWGKAYPDTAIVAYRLDIPRDCRDSVTQRLDGYGPFALAEETQTNITFVETGRPLTYEQWDHDVTQDIFAGKQTPPDDDADDEASTSEEEEDFSPQGIRSREEGKRVLAVYTPGRSYGSVSFVFPEIQLCASGFTIPIEDNRNEENFGMESAGPALDCRGYITTSRAGISRQMESARNLIEPYVDRFNVLLPSRGDPFFLDGDVEERKEVLMEIVDQYEKIGKIYEQLGITSYDDGDDDM